MMFRPRKIEIRTVRRSMEQRLLEEGVDEDGTVLIVDDYIESELEGKLSHGLRAFPSLLKRIDKAKDAELEIIKETESLLYLDANQEFGQVVGQYIRGRLENKSKQNGFAVGVVKNMQPFLRPGFQARKIAEKGFVGIVTNSTKNLVSPYGGSDPILGTNPLGYAVPFEDGIIVADFATSKRANGEVKMAKLKGSNLPEEVFFDKNGEYTDDPEAVYSIDIFGEYKGFAISLLIEILTGSLVGAEVGEKDGKSRNAMFVVMDPVKFTDYEKFLAKNKDLVEAVKNSRARKGMEIFYPGERSQKRRQEVLDKGYFEVNEEVVESLKKSGIEL